MIKAGISRIRKDEWFHELGVELTREDTGQGNLWQIVIRFWYGSCFIRWQR